MDRQQILLAKSLSAAEIPLTVNSFADRLILQKAAYLLQNAGINLGYRFRWYLRGPYSPEMTAGAFAIVQGGETARKELDEWKLDTASMNRIEVIKPLLLRDKESKSDQARRLELLASILFLFKTDQAKSNDPEGTSKILEKNDKIFSSDQVTSAVKDLRSYGLLV